MNIVLKILVDLVRGKLVWRDLFVRLGGSGWGLEYENSILREIQALMVESLRLSWRCAAGCLATSPTLLYNLMPILLAPISEAKEYTWHTIKRGFTEVFSNFLAW